MVDWTEDVHPSAARYCRAVFWEDQDKETDALSYCWYLWSRAVRKDLNPAAYARMACLAVKRGQASCNTRQHMVGHVDTWDHTRLSGEMATFPDYRPGTFRLVVGRDLLRALTGRVGSGTRHLLALMLEGTVSPVALARLLGRSRTWVTRRLRRLRHMVRAMQR